MDFLLPCLWCLMPKARLEPAFESAFYPGTETVVCLTIRQLRNDMFRLRTDGVGGRASAFYSSGTFRVQDLTRFETHWDAGTETNVDPDRKPTSMFVGLGAQGAERGWNPHSLGRTCFLAIVSLQYNALQCSKRANARPLRRTMPGKMTAETLCEYIFVTHTQFQHYLLRLCDAVVTLLPVLRRVRPPRHLCERGHCTKHTVAQSSSVYFHICLGVLPTHAPLGFHVCSMASSPGGNPWEPPWSQTLS